jgi:glycosyltransferase involved in cell wall biosynthesis
MTKPKVLYVLHNHPDLRPGGSEAYTLDLYEAMVAAGEFEPILLARLGEPNVPRPPSRHPGTPFVAHERDPNQYFVVTDLDQFDLVQQTLRDKSLYTRHFADFLRALRPDVVHFQHTLFLGYDLVSQARRVLPEAPILYTLHDYWPICHREGLLLRTKANELCLKATPGRCHECFPSVSPQEFFLRTRFVKSRLAAVDLFLSPSQFLIDRFVDWGVAADRIRLEQLGRFDVEPVSDPAEERPRTRFGFFGQVNRYKGVDVLLEAARMLEDTPDARVWLHTGGLEFQPADFQTRFAELLERAKANVVHMGPYDRAALPALMAGIDWVVVPSIWWENSPLVIQEAFQFGRPVICSNIGAMAEKVTDQVNGLHFRVGDPTSLARKLRQAATTPGLWERLRSGIPEAYSMDRHVASLGEIYLDEITRRREHRQTRLRAAR